MDTRMNEAYISLLLNSKEWIKTRVNLYQEQEISSISLLTEWQMLVCEISESLINGSKLYGIIVEGCIPERIDDPMQNLGRTFVKRLQTGGVELPNVLKMLKCYRQACLDLFDEKESEIGKQKAFSYFTERCFDRIELETVNEWKDISAQKKPVVSRAPINLKGQIENKYLAIFENMFSPLIFIDEKNRILNFNIEASYIFPEIYIGEQVFNWEFDSKEKRYAFLELFQEYKMSKNHFFSFKTNLHTPKGKRYFKIVIKKFNRTDHSFNGALIVLEDLTEINKTHNDLRKAKSKAEEADRLKTAFLANMSHEIRTPMHAIIGFTELLMQGNYGLKERKEYLELIRRSSNDLFNIIEDLIDIAKMESKQIKIKYKDCQPYKLLSGLYPIFQESFRRHGINNDVNLMLTVKPEDRRIHLFTDEERLKQVISNLMNNAIKFTDHGFIEYGFKQSDEDQLLFFVRDSGMGIPEAMNDKIFDRFYQMEEHQQKNHGGAGLGLAICRNIVTLFEGRIWFESTVNTGSCFYFQLPYRVVPEEIAANAFLSEKNGNSAPDWSSKRIIVAEDDQINFVYIQEVLSQCGAHVIHAKNGIEAIEIAELENKVDMILMDIKMPMVDGLEASKYISQIRSEIPIVALTAFAMEDDKPRCLKAGCVDYLSKPIDKKELYAIIDKYIHFKEAIPQKKPEILK